MRSETERVGWCFAARARFAEAPIVVEYGQRSGDLVLEKREPVVKW